MRTVLAGPATWVVVGGSGFVGSHLVRHLEQAGVAVTVVATPRTTAAQADEGAAALARAAVADPRVDALATAFGHPQVVVMAGGRAEPGAPWSAELVGANAVAPALVAVAAARAGVPRLIHLSSAAVQGRRRVLTEDAGVSPFSPYSRSKALGEAVLRELGGQAPAQTVVVRATSVQGRGRPTTQALRRVARSPVASVAGHGRQPSAASSVLTLAALVHHVGSAAAIPPAVVLQPWEGLSVADVLRAAGGREPRHLPAVACRAAVAVGYLVTLVLSGRGRGALRRLEAMWFGQAVDARWAARAGFSPSAGLVDLLADATSGDPVVPD